MLFFSLFPNSSLAVLKHTHTQISFSALLKHTQTHTHIHTHTHTHTHAHTLTRTHAYRHTQRHRSADVSPCNTKRLINSVTTTIITPILIVPHDNSLPVVRVWWINL